MSATRLPTPAARSPVVLIRVLVRFLIRFLVSFLISVLIRAPMQAALPALTLSFTLAACAVLGPGFICPAPAHAEAPVAERIFHGGPIVTVDAARPNTEAVAVAGGKIVAVGDEAKALPDNERSLLALTW